MSELLFNTKDSVSFSREEFSVPNFHSEFDSSTFQGTLNTQNDEEYNDTIFEEVEIDQLDKDIEGFRTDIDNNKQSLIESNTSKTCVIENIEEHKMKIDNINYTINNNHSLLNRRPNNQMMGREIDRTTTRMHHNDELRSKKDDLINFNLQKNNLFRNPKEAQHDEQMIKTTSNIPTITYLNTDSAIDMKKLNNKDHNNSINNNEQNHLLTIDQSIPNNNQISENKNQSFGIYFDDNKNTEAFNTTSYLKIKRAIRKVEKFKPGLSQEIFTNIIALYKKIESSAI